MMVSVPPSLYASVAFPICRLLQTTLKACRSFHASVLLATNYMNTLRCERCAVKWNKLQNYFEASTGTAAFLYVDHRSNRTSIFARCVKSTL